MAVILIVEDEFFVRQVAELMIGGWGHSTLSAVDGEGALSILRSAQPIDALFTDIRLKPDGLSGYELSQQARTLRPELRVLYTTGDSLTDKIKLLFVSGAHFLQKPYMPRGLQDSIEGLLAS